MHSKMGRGKHITIPQRKEIFRLRNENKSLKEISQDLGISINACHQALKHVKLNNGFHNKIRPEKQRNESTEKSIVCLKLIVFGLQLIFMPKFLHNWILKIVFTLFDDVWLNLD